MTDTEPSALRHYGIADDSHEARLLRFVLETAAEAVGGDEASLLVHDRTAGDLRFAMTVGNAESERKLRGQRVPIGQGVTGMAGATHEVQVGSPTYTNIQQTEGRERNHPEAVCAAPMLNDDELLGVMTVVSFAAGRRFDAVVARQVGRLAAIAAVMVQQHIDNTGLRQRLDPGGSGLRDARQHEIELIAGRIARKRPDALQQLIVILQSFEIALDGARRAS